MPALTREQAARFWTIGCVVIEDAATAPQLASMRADFDGWIEESRSHPAPFGEQMDGRPRFDVDPDHSAEHPSLRRVASPTELSDAYLDVLQNSRMTDAVADLIGPDIKFHHSKINSKLPHTATTVKWHQDFTFDPHSNDDLITALLFLDDVTEENGPLKVAPGSHKGPLLSLRQGGAFTGAVAEEHADGFERYAEMQKGPAGSVCLMHSRVAHASSSNRSDRARTLFICAISAADAVPLSPYAVPSVHAGIVLRGEDRGEIRSIPFEMETPEVPAGASFFTQQAAM